MSSIVVVFDGWGNKSNDGGSSSQFHKITIWLQNVDSSSWLIKFITCDLSLIPTVTWIAAVKNLLGSIPLEKYFNFNESTVIFFPTWEVFWLGSSKQVVLLATRLEVCSSPFQSSADIYHFAVSAFGIVRFYALYSQSHLLINCGSGELWPELFLQLREKFYHEQFQ